MKDDYSLDKNIPIALKRFYVVEDVNRASEGFSQTWYPHLYRIKMKQIVDSQEFKEILDLPTEEGSSQTLRDVLSTYEREMQVNDAVVKQAEADSPKSGYDTSHLYTLQVDANNNPELVPIWNKVKREYLVIGIKSGMTFQENGRSTDLLKST